MKTPQLVLAHVGAGSKQSAHLLFSGCCSSSSNNIVILSMKFLEQNKAATFIIVKKNRDACLIEIDTPLFMIIKKYIIYIINNQKENVC